MKMHDAAGRLAAANTRFVKLGVGFHVADLVRQHEMVEPIERRRELVPVVGRVQDIRIGTQQKKVTGGIEIRDQLGYRFVEREDVLPGLDKFLVRQVQAREGCYLRGELFGRDPRRSRTGRATRRTLVRDQGAKCLAAQAEAWAEPLADFQIVRKIRQHCRSQRSRQAHASALRILT